MEEGGRVSWEGGKEGEERRGGTNDVLL